MSDNSNLLRIARMLPMDPRHRQLLTDSAAEIEALTAERDALRDLLSAAASDLAEYVDNEYPEPTRSQYPDTRRRYERDMELVYRIRAALKGQTDE